MSCDSFRYLFGPVASRRFGRSLGVDLLGQRVCSFDCIFCEAGPTATCTMERAAYVPVEVVVAELRAWSGSGGTADVITLAGRGEPTLHKNFGSVIDAIHRMCSMPVVLLSNGSLFGIPEVRKDAARADIVKVSLSGWDTYSVGKVNRPARDFRFDSSLEGMIRFRQQFQGELRVEVMFVAGLNTDLESVEKLAACVRRIDADIIELNTVVRPPADASAGAVSREVLQEYAVQFGPGATVLGLQPAMEPEEQDRSNPGDLVESIARLLLRRGCTRDELISGIGAARADIEAGLQQLLERGRIACDKNRTGYFQLIQDNPQKSENCGKSS